MKICEPVFFASAHNVMVLKSDPFKTVNLNVDSIMTISLATSCSLIFKPYASLYWHEKTMIHSEYLSLKGCT